MRLIRPEDWTSQPWRNGGGVTDEIAAAREGAALLWRLSTAQVISDGAYSRFPGLTRISTVIEGAGTTVREREGGSETVIPPLTPTILDGNADYDGVLQDGPFRHLNFIHDPARIGPEVRRLDGPATTSAEAGAGEALRLVFCVTGTLSAGALVAGRHHTLVCPAPPWPIDIAEGAVAVEIRITTRAIG